MATAPNRACPARIPTFAILRPVSLARKTKFDGTKLPMVCQRLIPTTNGMDLAVFTNRPAATRSSDACETRGFSSDATPGSSPLPACRAAPHTAETTDAPASIARPSPRCAARCAVPDRSSIPRTSGTRPDRNSQSHTQSTSSVRTGLDRSRTWQPEHSRCVRDHLCAERRRIDAAKIRDHLQRAHDVGRLVALAAIRLGCKVRRVRLDHHAIVGNDRGGLANRRGVPERDDSRERNAESKCQEFACRIGVAGEAMNHAAPPRNSGFSYNLDHPALRVAAMNHDRQVEFAGELKMRTQRGFLSLARRMHVVEVKPALADRDDLLRRRQLAQLCDARGRAVLRVVRMHADCGEHVLVMLGDFDRQSIVLDWADRANRDDLRDAGVSRPRNYALDLVAQLRVSEVAVRVDDRRHSPHANRRRCCFLAYCFPLPRSVTDWLALSASSIRVIDDDCCPTESGANWTMTLHF